MLQVLNALNFFLNSFKYFVHQTQILYYNASVYTCKYEFDSPFLKKHACEFTFILD